MSDERRRDVTDPSPDKPSERLLTLEREIDEGLEQFVRSLTRFSGLVT